MKKFLFFFYSTLFFFTAVQAQFKLPANSPRQIIKQNFGIGSIEINYSRPSVKERKIFGELVPLEKLWRTGANEATKITFTEPVEIGGKKVDTGSYALYTIPGEKKWEIILNKGIGNWGTDGYKESEDVARFKVKVSKTKKPFETFNIEIINMKADSCSIVLQWDSVYLSIPVVANFKDKLRNQLELAIKNEKKPPYYQAAQFYKDYDKDLTKALEYANKATDANKKAYWIFLYKAKLQKEMGDLKGALSTSNTSLELATAEKDEEYVKLNTDFQTEIKKLQPN